MRNQLEQISPDHEITTLIVQGGAQPPAYAQMRRYRADATASLVYALVSPLQIAHKLPILLDRFAEIAGEGQALAILADVPSTSELLPSFRRSNYITWARQIVFQLKPQKNRRDANPWRWRPWQSADLPAMQSLYRRLVPAQFQAIEPLTRKRMQGMLLHDAEGQLLAYADLDQGRKGFWAQLFVLPELNDPRALRALCAALSEHYEPMGRPFYLACRSYQPWLQDLAQRLELPALPEQALLVRYLVRFARDESYVGEAELAPIASRVPLAQLTREPARSKK